MTSFENIPSEELQLVITKLGLNESEDAYQIGISLWHQDEKLWGTRESFDLAAEILFDRDKSTEFLELIDDEWFTMELSGKLYDMNIWIDDIRNQIDASIYPIVEDEHGPDTDCSQLIHRITNIKFN